MTISHVLIPLTVATDDEQVAVEAYRVDMKWKDPREATDPTNPVWSEYFVDPSRDLEEFKGYATKQFPDFDILDVKAIQAKCI